MKSFGRGAELFASVYTCVLQPYDVEVVKSLTRGIYKYFMNWASNMCANLNSNQRLPIPGKKENISWIVDSFGAISSECIPATFQHIGLTDSEISLLATPYPATSFPFLENSDGCSVADSDGTEFDGI